MVWMRMIAGICMLLAPFVIIARESISEIGLSQTILTFAFAIGIVALVASGVFLLVPPLLATPAAIAAGQGCGKGQGLNATTSG